MNPVARHSAGLSVALAVCYIVWMLAGAVGDIDRFTGSDGALVQMQIDALQVELDILQEGK